MKVLILGGSGMLGHKAYQLFSENFDTYVTFRNYSAKLKNTKLYEVDHVLDNVDALDFKIVENIINTIAPNVVLNCIGIIKQLPEAQNAKKSIFINALFPHLLTECCEKIGTKLIQISTDCVFSGKKGNYSENDLSDATDLYGKTKFLGEIYYNNALTIRTSIIGHELFSDLSLVDWFLSNRGKSINGFSNAIYTGLPTITFVKEIIRIIKKYPKLTGLYNLSSNKISKYNLLRLIKEVYKLDIEIIPYDNFKVDRSLDSTPYRNLTGFIPLIWEEMVQEMYYDYLNYRNRHVYVQK